MPILPCATPGGLAAGAADVPLLDDAGRIVDPAVVVRVDGGGSGDAAAAARRSPRILVGVATRPVARGPFTEALDLTVVPAGSETGPEQVGVADPVAAATALAATVRAHPQAATVLAGLLRWSGSLDVPAALDAESFAYSTLLGGPEFAAWLRARGPRPAPPPAADPVLVERDGGTLHVTLHRPERRNAYGREVRDALVAALEVAAFDPSVTRVVLDGAGPAFCSGGDLAEFGTAPDPVTAHLVRTRGGAGRLLHRLADRTEVRLHGPCVGAGIELPAFAQRVVAAPGTTVRLPEIGMGLIPGAGGTVSLPRRIGRWRTLYLALDGGALDVSTARTWGLVDG